MSLLDFIYSFYAPSCSNFGIVYDVVRISTPSCSIKVWFFIFYFSFYHLILNNCLSTSFIIFFSIVSGSRIQIYFVLDISFEEVRKKIPSKIDYGHFFSTFYISFFILSFYFVQLLISLFYHFFSFIISYSLLFCFFFLFLCFEPRIMKKRWKNWNSSVKLFSDLLLFLINIQ